MMNSDLKIGSYLPIIINVRMWLQRVECHVGYAITRLRLLGRYKIKLNGSLAKGYIKAMASVNGATS